MPKKPLSLVATLSTALWGTRVRQIVTSIVAVIGFASSVSGLWPLIFPETPDTEIKVVLNTTETIHFDGRSSNFPTPPTMIADVITVDKIVLDVPAHTLFVANKLILRDGATIHGVEFSVIATEIQGGTLDASGPDGSSGDTVKGVRPTDGVPAGRISIAAAAIEGTVIVATGGKGGQAGNGRDGPAKPHAADGANGSCAGFGGYSGAHGGADGEVGTPGMFGQDGGRGGDGGSILLLLSVMTPPPIVNAHMGLGGVAGVGGRGGPGQKGGQGGAGCVGLGGSQTAQPSGHDGPDGKKGDDGRPGPDGHDGSVTQRHVRFKDVATAWRASGETNQDLATVWNLSSAN